MGTAVRILPYAVAGGFLLLALVAATSWLRQRDTVRGGLAIAASLLGLVALIERVHALTGYRHQLLEDLSIAAFLASGYGLLILRHRVLPISRAARVASALAVISLVAVAVAVRMPPDPTTPLGTTRSVVAFALILAWATCVLEPIVRFWGASVGRSAVQRARLRAAGYGYGGIGIVLAIAFLADPSKEGTAFGLAVNLVALGLLPLLHAAFVPPRWLRRLWRAGEERAMGRAMGHLLEAALDPDAVVRQAALWAPRLVGGEAAIIGSRSRGVLAASGIDMDEAARLWARLEHRPEPEIFALDERPARYLVHHPVGTPRERGALVVLSGPLTPFFGRDEMDALGRFAASVWAILDHAWLLDALREEALRYESLLQAVSDLGTGVVVLEGTRVVYANEAFCAITGYGPEELEALPSLVDLAPADQRPVIEARARRRRSGMPTDDRYEAAMVHKRGHRVEVEVAIKPIERGGRVQFITLIRDITRRKATEQALRRGYERERQTAARLRTLDEMKSTFLAAVSHELRTPLTAVLGFARTLETRIEAFGPEERTQMVAAIARNGAKLERLLADLLDLDRLQRGLLEPRGRPTDLAELLRRTVDEMDMLEDRAVEVDAEAVFAVVDPPKVERIVENLLANTVRHTPAGTPIWVRVERAGDEALIVVEDGGPGIRPELRSTIFQPFEQGDGVEAHNPGVGIGLSLVAQFARLHGGRAWVEERPGGGASFRVGLPIDGSEPSQPTAAEREARKN